ncbi:MAG: NUDIX domain-containing protein [Alphaproteobacteria bacterium]|nr:NUDIX domain-containing protein [Alphaproteobacteria bacterium]
MLKVYDTKMNSLYNKDKKIVHEQALWHKVVTGILFNKRTNSLYFQTIYPKKSYTFDRPDYIDFSIGGHVEDNETIREALIREAKEELDLSDLKLSFLGIRICNCDPAPTYRIREFQYFYAIETRQNLQEMSFLHSDKEVKSIIEVKIDDFLNLLLKIKSAVLANEMILNRETRHGTYVKNITLTADRIIPDYYDDKSIFEKILTLKALIEE